MASTNTIYNPGPGGLAVPQYTERDGADLFAQIEETPDLVLPILHDPGFLSSPSEATKLRTSIVAAFFGAIENKGDDVVVEFVSRGLVSPDVTNHFSETPLLTAVRVGNVAMVRLLISLGALVDGYGRTLPIKTWERPERTALQEAAGRGSLAIVRVLMEEFGANDALIAPDGSLALRLAAENGHKEIVQYLPVRRGGAWRRWKTAHRREMKVIRRAVKGARQFCTIMFWDIPKFLLWVGPKDLVVAAWQRRHEFGGWVKTKILSIPSLLKQAGKYILTFIKKLPRRIWDRVRAIPRAIKIILDWVTSSLKAAGVAVAGIFKRFASVLHTVVVAVLTWFKSITIKDVWNGICSAMRAVFVDFPEAVWSMGVSFVKTTYKVVVELLGNLGRCIWYIIWGIGWLLLYIPSKFWVCVKALGRLLKRGFKECLVYFDPKRI